MHEDAIDERESRRMKSIKTVPGAGHLTVQDNPRGVALAIRDILIGDYGSEAAVATCKL